MADNTHKLPENVPGPWYVDDTCTPCRVCLDEAPQLLKYNDDETYVYFFKQPEGPEERNRRRKRFRDLPAERDRQRRLGAGESPLAI